MEQRKPILLAEDTITAGDIDRLIEWLKTYPRLTKGEQTIMFEQEWAKVMGTRYAVFVNSGSSANLLMIYALIEQGKFKNKSQIVVVPALSWITTISPVIQLGLEPVLVDCNMQDLSVDLNHLEHIFKDEQPTAMILVPVLGLVPEMQQVSDLCKKYNVILLIDNCEGQGSKYFVKEHGLETEKIPLECFGLMSSCSTYFGHILSTIEGGMITTDDEELYNLLKMLRSHGWTRDIDEQRSRALQQKYNISDFNQLYTFYHPAFNVRSTDLQAFIGLMQLKRLDLVTQARNNNYKLYNNLVVNSYWKPQEKPNVFVSNLGYPVIYPDRDLIVAELRENGVEARPLISGSMGQQPFFTERYGKQVFQNADIVDKFGFYVPNHPYLEMEEIEFICSIINKYTNQ